MNKYEIYNQKIENNKNIREIKNRSQDINITITTMLLLIVMNTICNGITTAIIICNYEILEKILEKL